MISERDCRNLSIALNWLLGRARSGLRHRDWEKFLECEEFHGDDSNPLHNFDDIYLPEMFAIRAIPSYHFEADVKLSISCIYLEQFIIVDYSRGLY